MDRLTDTDRQQIAYWARLGNKSPTIALKLGKDRTVVWRELKRNAGESLPYDANHAQQFADRRAQKTNRRKLEKDSRLRDYVVARLKDDWSPEQIAGRLKEYPPPEVRGVTVSHESIYQWIYDERHGQPWLYHQLRNHHWVRRPRARRKHREPILNRVSIHERPDEITNRTVAGHFESDSIVGRGKRQGLSVQYERQIQLGRLHRLRNFTANETKEALVATTETLPNGFAKSFTFDNGSENAQHEQLTVDYGIRTYFCDPYKPWQKGGVENLNRLIRQYIPKRRRMEDVPDEEIRWIEGRLNTRPRKGLKYATPNERLAAYSSPMLH